MDRKTTQHWRIRHLGNGRFLTTKEWMVSYYVQHRTGLLTKEKIPWGLNIELDNPFFDPKDQDCHSIVQFKTLKKAQLFLDRFNLEYDKAVADARRTWSDSNPDEDFRQPPHPLMSAVLLRHERTVETRRVVEFLCSGGANMGKEIANLEKQIQELTQQLEDLRG